MNNSNLEFRKIPSLNFLYEINSNGTILRNVKSKKQLKIQKDSNGYFTIVKIKGIEKKVLIEELINECWKVNGMKPVLLNGLFFESRAAAARYIESNTDLTFEAARARLKAKRKKILSYNVVYLNAETVHTRSTEQETVHLTNDLTGDYKTAFNEGKQAEVEERVRHTGLEVNEE